MGIEGYNPEELKIEVGQHMEELENLLTPFLEEERFNFLTNQTSDYTDKKHHC